MKSTIAAIAITLALVGSALAKKHQAPAPNAHEYGTGIMTASFLSYHSDSSASVTVDGHTSSIYCTETGTHIDCSDKGGYFIFHVTGAGLDFSFQNEGMSSNVLSAAFLRVESDVLSKKVIMFQYRLVTAQQEINIIVANQRDAGILPASTRGPLMCLPVKNEIYPTHDQNSKPSGPDLGASIEACYDLNKMLGYENHMPVDTKGVPDAPDISSLPTTSK
jgi:hypothetical protein